MKKALVAIVALLATFAVGAEVVSFSQVWDNQPTNATIFVPTPSGNEAQVTIIGNSTPDGTVTVYTCPNRSTAGCVAVATYATPTTAKTYFGTSSPQLYVTLTGNTTGSVDVLLVLKK